MRLSFLLVMLTAALAAAEIGVGPGKGFTRIEDALAQANAGDTVVIHARSDGGPYRKTAVRITKPHISLRGMPDGAGKSPVLDGSDGSYDGSATLAKAIIEFAPEAEGGSVSGLRLTKAHNRSHDAAGIRVDAANDITITNCVIDACDNGIISTGAGPEQPPSMQRLLVRDCTIRGNGDPSDAGTSHNLHLGGSGARIVGCLIEDAATGSNIKSRLATLLVEACVIRNAAQREIDLVDALGVTDQAGGFALILGSLIVKNPACTGNKAVIQWGQDTGANRLGNLYLVHCTVITPFAAPVIELSAAGAQVCLVNDLISSPDANTEKRTLVARRGAGIAEPFSTTGLWLSGNYTPGPKGTAVTVGKPGAQPPLNNPSAGDWRPAAKAGAPIIDGAIPVTQMPIPIGTLDTEHPLRQRIPILQTFGGQGAVTRIMAGTGMDLGAFEAAP